MAKLEDRNRLKILYEARITKAADLIAKTWIPQSTIYDIINRIKNSESIEHQKGAGRPPKTDANDRRRIVQLALRHPL